MVRRKISTIEPYFYKNFIKQILPVPRFASPETGARGPRPWRGFTHGLPITAKSLEEKGATGQDTIMTMDWGGGGDTERGPEGV